MENKKIELETSVGGFYVDMMENKLSWKPNPDIQVLLSDALFDGKHYSFLLERSVPELEVDSFDPIVLTVPQLIDIDRDEFIKQYNLEGVDLAGKNDLQAKMLQPSLIDRQKFEVVTVDIAGNTYELNYASESLLPDKLHMLPEIKLYHINTILGAKKSVFLLDLETRSVARDLTDNVVAIEMPSPQYMDPFGYARAHGREISEEVLKCGPLKNHHVAKTMNLTANDSKKLNQRSNRKRGLGR